MYAILLTYCGGGVAHLVKKMHLIVDSSMESEAVATGKCGELVSYAREILRAFGIPQRGPTFVGSDNKANALIASGVTLPSRSRHCLRRYLTFLQRLRRGEVEVGHVPDVENPSDFLTKWVPKDKSDRPLRYATNVRNVVHATGVSSEYNARAPSPTLALGSALMPTPRDTVWTGTTGK